MSLPETLLHYRIVQPIGRGGMGEVYLAEDAKLHRRVALKILPEIFALDPERRQRFEREAQAVAALNHPNIVTIYSVEEADGIPFLTMELVEGKPLNDLIPSGGMPLPQLLKIGTAVADAISAAQQRGITHRDLKPANVMVTSDGRVKVLDFGLARLQEARVAAAGEDVTHLAGKDMTGEGKIIGTVAYMSPEQAEGKPVDPRSDIFSLGVLLHEMATGDRPFKGDTNVSIISSILKDTPSSITDLNPKLPTDLARIVRRCLAKDPAKRFQTATDVRAELEDLQAEITSGSGITSKPSISRGRSPVWIGAGAIVALLIVFASAWFLRSRRGHTTPAEQEFTIDRFTRLTISGVASMAALSRDARYVAHVKQEGGEPSLWVRQTATSSDVRIVPPAPVVYDGVTFSPDGNYVFYNTYKSPGGGTGTLYRIPVLGGDPVSIIDDVDGPPGFSPDGSQLVFPRGLIEKGTTALMLAAVDGSGVRELTAMRPPERFQSEGVAWSPDGRTLLASVGRGAARVRIFAVDVATRQASPVGEEWAAARGLQWMPDGRSFLLTAVDRQMTTAVTPQIWRVSYPSGVRSRVTNDLNSYFTVSLSADGRALATVQGQASLGLSAIERGGHQWRTVTEVTPRADGAAGITLLPDGRIVYGVGGGGSLPQIWIVNPDGSGVRQLTNQKAPAIFPRSTPDGAFIYFESYPREGLCIFRIAVDGSGLTQITKGGDEGSPIVSPDGRTIYVTRRRAGQPHPARVPSDGGEPVQISDAFFDASDISPDGTRLVGTTWDSARRRPVTATLRVDGSGGPENVEDVQPGARWLADGSVLFIDRRHQPDLLMMKDSGGGPPRPAAPPLNDRIINFAVARDGRTFIAAHGTQTTDVVLIGAATSAKQD